MLKQDLKTDLSQISLTGVRAIVLLGLLMRGPRTLDEIRQKFIEYKIMQSENSDDILRIDINTLRQMGCEISRADIKTDFKYILTKHPFTINVTSEEVEVLKKSYNKVKDTAGINILLEYDKLFRKIAEHVESEDVKQEIYGISILKSYNLDNIYELIEDCEKNRTITLLYKIPASKTDSTVTMVADKIMSKNDKIYICGMDLNKKEIVTLNIKRILKIISRKKRSDSIDIKPIVVKFNLKDFGVSGLEETEHILEINPSGYLIEGEYYNEFWATQRILSFGSNCTVIEPENFRNKIIDVLKRIRKVYNG